MEDILITYFFLSVMLVMLVVLCVTCSCWSVHRNAVYASFLLNQKISYTKFDGTFLQGRTSQVS